MLNYQEEFDNKKQVTEDSTRYFVIFKFADTKYVEVVKEFLTLSDVDIYSENVYVSYNLIDLINVLTNLYRKNPEIKYSLLTVEILKVIGIIDAMNIFEKQNLN